MELDLDSRVRTLLVGAVTLAYPTTMAGFELGAYGELFYDRKITAWCMVTAVLLALLLLPRRFTPASRWHYGVLAVPSIWLLVVSSIGSHTGGAIMRPVLFALSLASYLICMPYAVLLIVSIVSPDFLRFETARPKLTLVGIALFFFASGFLAGARNDVLLTCQNFEIAGETPPANCRPAPSSGTDAAAHH